MATVTVSNHVAAPVEQVFRVFTDIEHGPEHVGGIKKVEMLTPGVVHLGTRWRETRDVLGRSDSAEMEITAFELNRMYTITHHKAGVRIDTTFWFEPEGPGRRCRSSSSSMEAACLRACSRRSGGRSRARSGACSATISSTSNTRSRADALAGSRAYLRPSCLPAASSVTDSRRRFSRVSGRFAMWIHTT